MTFSYGSELAYLKDDTLERLAGSLGQDDPEFISRNDDTALPIPCSFGRFGPRRSAFLGIGIIVFGSRKNAKTETTNA